MTKKEFAKSYAMQKKLHELNPELIAKPEGFKKQWHRVNLLNLRGKATLRYFLNLMKG